MSQQPVWQTEAGSLGTVPEGRFYSIALRAIDPDFPTDPTQIEYSLLAGKLPAGVQVQKNGILEGIPISIADFKGVPAEVSENTESKFTIRATSQANRIADRTFSLTVTGQDAPEFITPSGSIGQYFDGTTIDYQIEWRDLDDIDEITIEVISGTLPDGVQISKHGRITGFIAPALEVDLAFIGFDRDGTLYDQYPFDIGSKSVSTAYEFTLQITDGKDISTRKYSIFVLSRNAMTADNVDFTADNGFITADSIAQRGPYLINYTGGNLGEVRHDNFYAYQLVGEDVDGYAIEYTVVGGALPTGLFLDSSSGWIYGYLPDIGLVNQSYNFQIKLFREIDNAISSVPYSYNITLIGDGEADVIWITPAFLGYVNNGEFSTLYVEASHPISLLQYRFKAGEYSKLPQGLRLLPSGNIVGRTSFKTFMLDGGTTTFDSERGTRLEIDPTTFDRTFKITVEAYSSDGLVSAVKEFTLMIAVINDQPYNVLYAKAMPPRDDRYLIETILQNTDVFDPRLIYRRDDPNFGVASNVIYHHAYGLSPAAIEDYFAAMNLNHYKKQITLGEIKTARALDDEGNVLYEVVYSRVIDDLVNPQGVSISKKVNLAANVINLGPGNVIQEEINEVYPNSLENMRSQVISEIGQVSRILPRWMLSKQEDGRVLGFVPAWVIAYTTPGNSKLVAYRIQQRFGSPFNTINFFLDRFTLDFRLTQHWDIDDQEWESAIMTTFDRQYSTVDEIYETTFDQGSTRFISPVDLYEDTDRFDRYIMFPQVKIVDNDANT
jgi:hypothetical protein